MKDYNIPIYKKLTLTVDEAVAYSNIGEGKIRDLINEPGCSFALFIGNRRLIKRREFENFIESKFSI